MSESLFLHPDLAPFAGLVPPPQVPDPAQARETIRAFGKVVDTPERAALSIADRMVPGVPGVPPVPVRCYEPASDGSDRPAVLVIHGGGFIAGDLDTEDARCVRIASETGAVVVSVDYRLAPEHRYPAAVDDCDAALRWLSASAADLGVARGRIGILGTSSGGALAAAVALRCRDRAEVDLAFQALVCPVLDDRMDTASMTFAGTPFVDGPSCASIWQLYLPEGHDRATTPADAAPARAVDVKGLPPTYILTAEHDPLRDEGLTYAMRLLEMGVSVELRNVAGAFHGFDALPTELSERAVGDLVAWIRWVTTH